LALIGFLYWDFAKRNGCQSSLTPYFSSMLSSGMLPRHKANKIYKIASSDLYGGAVIAFSGDSQ
jgi:hypothetical protein